LLSDQEWSASFRYWEGAVEALDREGRAIGRGYVELTGYADDGPVPGS
jgi:predicted secreted hydrolase